MNVNINAKSTAFIAVFAALYAVLGYVPLFYIFGSYGTYITAALALGPIIGIILGPVGGVLAASVGGLAGMAITGNMPIGIFTFLPGAFDALCVGLAFRGKRYFSAALFSAFIVAFAVLPSIGNAWWFVWFHLVGLVVLLSPATTLAVRYVQSFNAQKLVLGVGILAFSGVLIDQIVGSFFYQAALGNPSPPSLWQSLAFVYPVERVLATILAAIIGAGIIRAVKTTGLRTGEVIL